MIFISRIRFNPESIRRVVARMALYIYRDSNGNLYVRYLYWNGDRWNWNYNWLDNDFDQSNPALLANLFISPPTSC